MSEMVERIARAIEAKSDYVISQHHAKALARAAIEALRDPSYAMLESGGISITRPGNDETNSDYEIWDTEVRQIWQAMIDEALSPPKPKR
jgi:hypothetical protein